LVERHADPLAKTNPPERLFLSARKTPREIAVMLLLDTSFSTDARINGRRILDVQIESLIVHALDEAAALLDPLRARTLNLGMARSLPMHGELKAPAKPSRLALAAKGFRPFFLLAALFAVSIVPLWLCMLGGQVAPGSYPDPLTWHAHEMVFGFALAVIAGFLLTAVGNWTQRETLIGGPLLGLALLWLLGRVAFSSAHVWPRVLTACVDLAFLPVLIVVLARPLIAARDRRNFAMLGALGGLFAANAVVHLDALGWLSPGAGRRACLAGIDLVLLVIAIIAGRVFPMFTRNATRVTSIRSIPSLDVASVAAMAALLVADVIVPETKLAAATAGSASVLAGLRARHWGARHAWRQPLLWILHAGYFWLVLGLALRALADLGLPVPSSLAWHVLTVGTIGALTLGMMARVALGHTGRMLEPAPAMTWAFAAINAAVIARVFVPWWRPTWYFAALIAAGVLWTLAFSIFLAVYLPMLVSPRVDGKSG
jgi:uncharacterized protein involved in response to NO